MYLCMCGSMNSQKNYPQGIIVRDEISNLHGAAPQTMAFKAFGSPKKDKKESLPDICRDQQQQQVQVNQTTLTAFSFYLSSTYCHFHCRLILARFTMHPFSMPLLRFIALILPLITPSHGRSNVNLPALEGKFLSPVFLAYLSLNACFMSQSASSPIAVLLW